MQDFFKQTLAQLNPEQKRAVESIEGPVMVVAGPGTGKTQVLAARIANILQKTDTNPRSILALTFTESAAKEMRQRLVRMIGRTGYYVQISTFHAFCSQVIQTHPEFFPIDRGSEPLADLERYDLYQHIINDLKLETLKPLNRPHFYITDIMFAISNLKREGFLPDDFAEVIEAERQNFADQKDELNKTETNKWQRNLEKWTELLEIYRAYQQRLRDSLRYDFDDMISLVVEAFQQNEILLLEYQENIHYFLVDEYQDTNTAQNKVVDLLASYWQTETGRPNVFVVGDPNQSIYRFQGASVENVLGFVHRYPQAEVITLETGYRCPQNIYNAAARVIRHNQLTELKGELEKFSFTEPLHAAKKNQGEIKVFEAPSQTLETVYVAEEIRKLAAQGVPLDQIAILYRHNRDLGEIQTALAKWGIRYEIDGGDDLLENEAIQQLLNLLQVINDVTHGDEDETLFEVMRYEWLGLDPVLVMKAGRAAGKAKLSLYDLISAGLKTFAKYDIGAEVTELEFAQLTNFLEQLGKWSQADANLIFPEFFEEVVKESGYLEWVMAADNKVDLLNHLNSLFREIKALAQSRPKLDLAGFLDAIDTMQTHGIKLNVEDLNVKADAVHLSTLHKAKGLEWQYVFILHFIDGKWGNNSTRELLPLPEGLLTNTDLSQKEQNEDERRNFYVALTRASQQVTITHPSTLIDESRSKEVVESMFLSELGAGDDLAVEVKEVKAPEIAQQADDFLLRLLDAAPERKFSVSEEEFFKKLVEDFSLSVTALNTYLRDPAEFVQNVLLKVPRAKPEPMAFGSAMHYALEKLFTQVMNEQEKPAIEKILADFEEALRKELLTSTDFERRLKYGQDILRQYYDELSLEGIEPLFVERFFGSGWSKTYLDDIRLTGRIDRVDWLDKKAKTVKVIDYKTGKEKSKNYIEGQIASANLSEREQQLPDSIKGPYKRQLLFYKLLTDLDDTFIPKVEVGIFDFVEPNSRGKLVQRQFELTDADVKDLKDLIKEVMAEIRSLKFLELT